MNLRVLLTTPTTDAGPFYLYSDTDGFVSPFATNVSKSTLLGGYVANNVPNGTLTVRLVSVGECNSYIDVDVTTTTTTTTTISV